MATFPKCLIKFIVEPRYDEVLGVEIIGLDATGMIAEAVLGIHLEATVNDFALAVYAHPRLLETIMGAGYRWKSPSYLTIL